MKKRSSHARPQATVRKKILVVEDDATSMKFLSLLLEGAGYEVFQATYSLPALFRVVRTAPDLILADLQMPIMNGLDLIRQLKGHGDTAHIPIVVVKLQTTRRIKRRPSRQVVLVSYKPCRCARIAQASGGVGKVNV